MKLLFNKLALPFLGLLVILCYSCATEQATTDVRPPSPVARRSSLGSRVTSDGSRSVPAEPSNIVAKISDYVITREQLEKRLISERRPSRDRDWRAEPTDAKTVLMKMIAEKAMIVEAREQNFLEDETTQALIKRFKDRKLIGLFFSKYLQGKITVTDSEIEERLKANPKLDRARAKRQLEGIKANRLVEQYYSQLCEKFHLQKLSDNFPEAAQIHQRLLHHPKTPRKMGFININQIKNELTPEEKNIVLATYDNGKITLKDWFDALREIAPPSRPKDSGTAKGVERLLDRALRMPIFVTEAKLLGLDKDENFIKEVRKNEDSRLLDKIRTEKLKDIKEPTEEQIVAYFEENKQAFGTPDTLKIDQIWCQDLETARKAKAELDASSDFEPVKQEYSLEKKIKPFNTYPSREGLFWKDLWNGDPNEIVGPVKGFYENGVKWRIVKILEKKPGKVSEYSDNMKNRIKWKLWGKQREAALEKYRKELLEKHQYEIYAERIKDIDPLDIP